MGARGKPPTPTSVLKLRGSWRAEINGDEPLPEKGEPKKPEWLTNVSDYCWSQLVPLLQDMDVLTVADGMALSLLCETFASWRKAEEMLQKSGEVYPILDGNGETKYLAQSPYVAIARNTAKQLQTLLREFGLTPSARSRIQVKSDTGAEKEDKRMKYLTGNA